MLIYTSAKISNTVFFPLVVFEGFHISRSMHVLHSWVLRSLSPHSQSYPTSFWIQANAALQVYAILIWSFVKLKLVLGYKPVKQYYWIARPNLPAYVHVLSDIWVGTNTRAFHFWSKLRD